MTPSTLRRIVTAAGGPEAFAAAIRVKLRFVYYLLAGKRRMSPRTEELARKLAEELGVAIEDGFIANNRPEWAPVLPTSFI